mgnify:CR=1 FL=1
MKSMDVVVASLLVVGGLNWGLVGLMRFDLVATLLGVLVLGETIPLLGWVGVACVLAGLALQGAASRLGEGQSLP